MNKSGNQTEIKKYLFGKEGDMSYNENDYAQDAYDWDQLMESLALLEQLQEV
tara:strand:- start:163 stop:318 length:156 start_codon:yes stop_codon:yes gene_type:complete